MGKLWYINLKKYYSPMKTNELVIVIHVTTWMDIKGIMMSEKSQSKVDNIIEFIYYIYIHTYILYINMLYGIA